VIEAELIERVLRGDATAERALYDTHVDRVYRLAYRMTGDEGMAAEYTQDTFVRAFQRLADFRQQAALSTWLHSIAVSVILNGQRRMRRHGQRDVDLDSAPTLSTSDPPIEPWLRQRLRRAIETLPERSRMVFVMHEVEGYTHEEIGSALQVAVGTSKSLLFRARARLRELLADIAQEYVG